MRVKWQSEAVRIQWHDAPEIRVPGLLQESTPRSPATRRSDESDLGKTTHGRGTG